jgi:hypothetical protein
MRIYMHGYGFFAWSLEINTIFITLTYTIRMRELGNLILLGSKPLPTAKVEIWACKILPGL